MFSDIGVVLFGVIGFAVFTILIAYGARLEQKLNALDRDKEKNK